MRKQEADARPAVPPCAPIARGRPSCSPAPSGPVVEESSSPASRPSLCFPCRGGVLLCAGAAQPHVSFRRCDAHGRRCAPPYSTPTFARPSAARRDAARLELRVPVRVDLLLPSASSGLQPCRAPRVALLLHRTTELSMPRPRHYPSPSSGDISNFSGLLPSWRGFSERQ